jgi:hypothetical protein
VVPTPAIPSFVDGTVVHQGDLNALASNLTNLYAYNQAGFFTQRPCVLVKQTTGQSIAHFTNVLVNYQTAAINNDNMWTASVANQLTIQHAGIYLLFAGVRWPAMAGASLNNFTAANILVNGTNAATNTVALNDRAMLSTAGGQLVLAMANLAAGATAYVNVSHNQGGAQTLLTDFGGSFFGAVFLTGP